MQKHTKFGGGSTVRLARKDYERVKVDFQKPSIEVQLLHERIVHCNIMISSFTTLQYESLTSRTARLHSIANTFASQKAFYQISFHASKSRVVAHSNVHRRHEQSDIILAHDPLQTPVKVLFKLLGRPSANLSVSSCQNSSDETSRVSKLESQTLTTIKT